MKSIYDAIIRSDQLSSDEREALHEQLAEKPELARAFQQWQTVRAAVREQMEDRWPDRHLLVLYALAEARGEEILTADERDTLEAAREEIEQALQAHPALRDVVDHIQDECDAFEATWEAHTEGAATTEEPTAAPNRTPEPAADRAPRRGAERTPDVRVPWRIAIGAVVVIMAVLALFFIPREPDATVVETSVGETAELDLSEDATVRLAEDSRLSYVEGEEHRPTLEAGGAFFDVGPATDDFIVETPTARTVVLGTQFGLEADLEGTRVVLADGRVSVVGLERPDESVTLSPGEESRVEGGAAPTQPEPVDVTEALEWTGLFVFRDQSMQAIADRLSDRYDVRIEVAPALREETITGTFDREQPVDQVLDVLAATLNADVERPEEGGYRIVAVE